MVNGELFRAAYRWICHTRMHVFPMTLVYFYVGKLIANRLGKDLSPLQFFKVKTE